MLKINSALPLIISSVSWVWLTATFHPSWRQVRNDSMWLRFIQLFHCETEAKRSRTWKVPKRTRRRPDEHKKSLCPVFVSISSEVSCCVERLGMENRSCKLICDQQSQGAAETGNVGLPTSKSALWSALTTPSNSILYIMQAHYPCILYIKRRIAAHGWTIVHSFWRRQTEACRVWKWSKREQGCQKDGLVADESTSKTKWAFILRVWIPREASFLQLSLQT